MVCSVQAGRQAGREGGVVVTTYQSALESMRLRAKTAMALAMAALPKSRCMVVKALVRGSILKGYQKMP
jgi:hypothetical protein